MLNAKILFAVICATLCLSHAVLSQVVTRSLGSMTSVTTGRVDVARLSDFASLKLTEACDLLMKDAPNEAAPLFQQELEHNPNDLAAFVGFAQSRPDLWIDRIASLEKSGTHDSISQFKLGLLLFYQWKTESSYQRQNNIRKLDTAKMLLTQAWANRKDPVIGMALVETTHVPFPDDVKANSLLKEMLKQLAGPNAFQAYKNAQSSGWQEPPPPVKTVALANRRLLHGVLSDLWSRAGSQIVYQAASDKKTQVLWKPLPINKQMEENYLNTWRTALLKP